MSDCGDSFCCCDNHHGGIHYGGGGEGCCLFVLGIIGVVCWVLFRFFQWAWEMMLHADKLQQPYRSVATYYSWVIAAPLQWIGKLYMQIVSIVATPYPNLNWVLVLLIVVVFVGGAVCAAVALFREYPLLAVPVLALYVLPAAFALFWALQCAAIAWLFSAESPVPRLK